MQRCPDIALARTRARLGAEVALDDGLARTIAYFDRMLTERGEKRAAAV